MPILKDIIDWVKNKPSFWQVAIDQLIRNNELTTCYINQNLKQNFKAELKKLGFKNIKIETKTIRTKRKTISLFKT